MKKFLLIFLLTPLSIYAGTTGKLSGSVKDAQTGEPLVGANILIVGTDLGAATNINGSYIILNISPGNYSVRVSFIGYESKIITEVGNCS